MLPLGRGIRNVALGKLFPTPEKLARARFNNIGLTSGRAETIRQLAKAVCNGDIEFDPAQVPEGAIRPGRSGGRPVGDARHVEREH